jgi:YVTN family beta-propeller protein
MRFFIRFVLATLLCGAILNARALSAQESQPAGQPSAAPARNLAERKLPGLQASGFMQLPNQWSLKPAGKQLEVGDFPVNIALHPDEPTAAVLHAGYGEHEVMIVALDDWKVISRVSVPETFVGLCISSDGKQVYASGAEKEIVHQFTYRTGGLLSDHRELRVAPIQEKYVPAGLSISADGKRLFAACPWADTVCLISLDQADEPKHLKLSKDDYPYTTLPTKDSQRLFVSLWGHGAVAVIDLKSEQVAAQWKTDAHPTEMLLSADEKTLYVACANSNHVCVLDTTDGKQLEVISSALHAKADPGSTPNSICLSPDGKVLFIANADNNNVAVIDVSDRGRSRSLGFIPVGWYPTSVRAGKDKLYVACGKGLGSKANRLGPKPGADPPLSLREYIGGLFQGTLAEIPFPAPLDMAAYTRTAFRCSPLREDKQPVSKPREDSNPIPTQVGGKSPIKYCLYIIKENRTYDQVFGDIKGANGDPDLCIFPEKVTPNHHALAKQFVILDNFYVESEVSADGHEWSMAAYATDFVEKSWPLMYRGSREGKLKYPSEGNFLIAQPAGGYLWDRAAEAKVSYRSYGEFVANPAKVGDPAKAKVKSLEGHFDPFFHGYDLDYSDQKRADRFIAELARFEKEGEMPQLQILRLPNDHTSGTSVGKLTPTAMVADNDLALGRVVEAISKSKFWKETAIFVVEDDAQNGSDHVDAHRTVALVISPYCRRGSVDSSLYSTASMLRTMELILGLKPMSQFDAAAIPMYNSFQPEANPATYKHLPNNVPLDTINLPNAYGAKLSASFDFSKEDAADDLLLNEVIWRSVRGPDSPMPAPIRAGFVFVHPEEEEEDDEEEAQDRKQK